MGNLGIVRGSLVELSLCWKALLYMEDLHPKIDTLFEKLITACMADIGQNDYFIVDWRRRSVKKG